MNMSRRGFMQGTVLAVGAVALDTAAQAEGNASMQNQEGAAGAVVICNHWTQFGIGETFPEGEIRGRWYRRNFSTVFGFEQGRRWLEKDVKNRVCHEFDAYFLEALAEENPEYLSVLRDLLDRRLMELPGGTFGQAESQVFGYESALRQLTFGQAAYHKYLGRGVDTFIVEEQNFFPQLPQLLKLAGFKYASVQFQNSGTPDAIPLDLILWEAMDGTTIPTVPNHPGMLSCAVQWKPYNEVMEQLQGYKAPLIFQWMELWPPGLDWGASIAPYAEAIHGAEAKGFRQMLLTEYIEWALGRCDAPKMRMPLDHSNYNNNFFQGGWGYENERTARGSNQCESLLLAAETLCAGGGATPVVAKLGDRLRDLWARLLRSQNHDPYLAGSVPAYVDGLRSFQSEIAIQQLAKVHRVFREEGGMDAPLNAEDETFRMFNPCPWPVTAPVLFELDETRWPTQAFTFADDKTDTLLPPVFRSDNGNMLVGPVMMKMASCEIRTVRLKRAEKEASALDAPLKRLTSKQDGHRWEVAQDLFAGLAFEPLAGEWKQVPSYFTNPHPNTNVETAHENLKKAPFNLTAQAVSDGMDVARWRTDLLRIREAEEPALSVEGLVFSGAEPTPFVHFKHRLTSIIRFETGARPAGTWRFRLHSGKTPPVVFADAPFSEERREAESFYCSRYVRLEWPDRHLLWCPSQNTLFRRFKEGEETVFECTVFDFSFTGTANWDMRFYAAPSFSAADSMRLAETCHRKPVRVAMDATAGRIAGITVDNPDVLITHVFPAEGGVVGVRMLNASDKVESAAITRQGGFEAVVAADTEGNALHDGWAHNGILRKEWECTFRPWEIATFCVM
jgi:hypothetical protein